MVKKVVFCVRFQRRRRDCQERARGGLSGSCKHPSRTLSEAPQTPLIHSMSLYTSPLRVPQRPFSEPSQRSSGAALRDFSESPPYSPHPLCRNDSRGEKGRFLCAVPETPDRLPGACQEGERKSSGSRRHLSRTLPEAPQMPLTRSKSSSHILPFNVPQRSSEVLSESLYISPSVVLQGCQRRKWTGFCV